MSCTSYLEPVYGVSESRRTNAKLSCDTGTRIYENLEIHSIWGTEYQAHPTKYLERGGEKTLGNRLINIQPKTNKKFIATALGCLLNEQLPVVLFRAGFLRQNDITGSLSSARSIQADLRCHPIFRLALPLRQTRLCSCFAHLCQEGYRCDPLMFSKNPLSLCQTISNISH